LPGVVRGVRVSAEVTARAEDGDAVAPHGRQVLAPPDQEYLGAAAVQRRAHVRADRPGAEDRDPHSPTSPDRLRRWTLPVGPLGISGRIVTRAGRLNAASRSPQ